MTDYSYILFNQTPDGLRRIGARGGKTSARNRRARRQTPPELDTPSTGALASPTTAHAIALLDAQFPWLAGAEKTRTPQRARR